MNRTSRLFAPLLMAAALPAGALAAPAVPAAAAETAYELGFEQAAIPDEGHAPIAAIIWYPTSAEVRTVQIGLAAITRTGVPMVVISHGTGAGAISHIDTAIALAKAGFDRTAFQAELNAVLISYFRRELDAP